MLIPKNIITYMVVDLPPVETIEAALTDYAFKPRGSQELNSSGWVPPNVNVIDDNGDPRMVVDSHGMWLITLKQQEADLKGSVVRDALNEKVDRIEADEARKVYRKEKMQLKDEVVLDLLPRAFDKNKLIHAFINPEAGFIFVDASSHTAAEDLLTRLREALGSLKVSLPLTALPADKVMTGWLQGQPVANGWSVEDGCELRDPMAESSKITAKGQDLLSEEITAHLECGFLVKRLALEWQQAIKLTLHEDLSLHSVKLTDEYRNSLDEEAPEDLAAALLSDVWRWNTELAKLFTSLILALGGQQYVLEQQQDGVAA